MQNLSEVEAPQTKFPEPREFQKRAHEQLRDGARRGHKNQVVMAPTGAGKTYLGLRIIKEALDKGRRCIFLCDRETLINQTSAVADSYGLIDHGVIQANHWRHRPHAMFQIASAQTIARRGWPSLVDVVVIDECHTQMKAWTEYIPTCKAAVIGLSATPFSAGLGNLFSNLINATTMSELTKQGVLVPMRIFSGTKPNMAGAKKVGGEWADNEAAARGKEIVGDVVESWILYASDRKTIIFGATVDHCNEIARRFNEQGIMAAVFSTYTPDAERQELLKEFRKPNSAIRVLVSVEALAKGFDVPDVGCVADCRPLRKSLSTAIQMWGRGLRSYPGKENCVLLDHSGNILRFRQDFETIFFSGLDGLDHGEKLDKEARDKEEEEDIVRACPECGFSPYTNRCMSCGHEKKRTALIEELEGKMVELELTSTKITHDRGIWNECCSYVRQWGKPDTRRQRAWYLYQDVMKATPPSNFIFNENDRLVEVGRRVENTARRATIRWSKRRT
jgi:hypothetical protein